MLDSQEFSISTLTPISSITLNVGGKNSTFAVLISEDGETFTVTPKHFENGVTVIIALYFDKAMVGMDMKTFTGLEIPFSFDDAYDNVKVMVWENMENLVPVCRYEEVELEQN